jgi:hypothetical protein
MYINNDKSEIIIQCDCGLEHIKIIQNAEEPYPTEYYLDFMISEFYTEQKSILGLIKNRIKILWHILTKGIYQYQEIILNEEEFRNLKEIIKNF